MGATTTQGTGIGAANKGKSPYNDLAVSKHIGPRIMAAGKSTCKDGSVSVEIPRLSGVPEMYVVLLTGTSPSPTFVSKSLHKATEEAWAFSLNSGTIDEVFWSVVKIGI